jgi:multimeric flavodoxin WrbA
MAKIVAVYGSPRRDGNTAALLREAVLGAREAGAGVLEFTLRDMKISPCLEIYGCAKTGRCVIQDDFHALADAILDSQGLMLASPVMFYTVSAHVKAFMDRCQSLWVKKYRIEKAAPGLSGRPKTRKGLFISVGATRGARLFDGMLLTVRYFFDVFDMELWRSVLARGADFAGDVEKRPELLEEARRAGRELAEALGG